MITKLQESTRYGIAHIFPSGETVLSSLVYKTKTDAEKGIQWFESYGWGEDGEHKFLVVVMPLNLILK